MIGYWAFWKSDRFPYYLGGEIERYTEAGLVETKQYGKGNLFTPRAILPPEEGERVHNIIDTLRGNYQADLELVEKLHRAKALEQVPFLSTFKSYGGEI